jgi:hypothetical protein
MPETAARPNEPGSSRWLSRTLVAGAVYDFVLAGIFLVAPRVLSALLSVPLPGQPVFTRVIGVLLAIAGAVYLVAARDPKAARSYVWIAIAGRTAGFLALALSTVGHSELAGLWPPALGDLAFAAAHLAVARGVLW